MNYAADALWWKLTDTVVRDLAGLLTAPPPARTGSELPVRTLLGDRGFRLLLELDRLPEKLHEFADRQLGITDQTENRNTYRGLPEYLRALLLFWFEQAPHAALTAPAGVADDAGVQWFDVVLNDRHYRIRATCGFYCEDSGSPALKLLPVSAGGGALSPFLTELETASAKPAGSGLSASLWRGTVFLAQNPGDMPPPVLCWHGKTVSREAAASFSAKNRRFARLGPENVLSPLRIFEKETLAKMPYEAGTMCALLEERSDGFWHETDRVLFSD